MDAVTIRTNADKLKEVFGVLPISYVDGCGEGASAYICPPKDVTEAIIEGGCDKTTCEQCKAWWDMPYEAPKEE